MVFTADPPSPWPTPTWSPLILLHDILPWRLWLGAPGPESHSPLAPATDKERRWAYRVDLLALLFVTLLYGYLKTVPMGFAVSLGSVYNSWVLDWPLLPSPWPPTLNPLPPLLLWLDRHLGPLAMTGQLLVVHLQLVVLVGLTQDGGVSYTGRILRSDQPNKQFLLKYQQQNLNSLQRRALS